MRLIRPVTLTLLGLAVTLPAQAQSPEERAVVAPGADIADLSLEALLSQNVSVTSRRGERARDATGIVTIFTREEILATGARDLSDLLQLVPGFSQNVDVENVLGLAVRGIWSYEGKVLLMVDGIDMTELLYSVNPLGMHYLTSNMERVEIIRGPGSAVYGGHAGMAVISIITRSAKDLQGAQVEGRYGQLNRTFSDRSVGLALGHTVEAKGELGLSLTGYWGQGNRSDGTYTDTTGQTWSMADHGASATDPLSINAAVTWRGLSARFLYDSYALGTIDGYGDLATVTRNGETTNAPATMLFETMAADVRDTIHLGDTVTLEPRFYWKRQRPWWVDDVDSSLFFEKVSQRFGGSVTATWDASDTVHLLGGVDFNHDTSAVRKAWLVGTGSQTDNSGLNPEDPTRAALDNVAVFAQLAWENPIANLTLGGRAEYHSVVGASVVPRIAATRTFDKLTVKLLYSGAFRAPDFENLNLSQSLLKPERIWVAEGQISYQITEWLQASINAYSIDIDEPIVYSVDANTGAEGYANAGHVGSRGVEIEAQVRGRAGFLRATASMAESSSNTTTPNFLLPDSRNQLIGMPGTKLTAFGHLKLAQGFSLNPSVVAMGPLQGQLGPSDYADVPWNVLVNVNARWDAPETLIVRGLAVTVGVNNMMDTQMVWTQGYAGGHPAMPARGRDYFARLSYALKF